MKQHFALFAAVVFPHTGDKTAATTMTIPDSANSKPFSLNDALAEKFSHIIATGNWQPALPVLDADYEISFGNSVYYTNRSFDVLIDAENLHCLRLNPDDAATISEAVVSYFVAASPMAIISEGHTVTPYQNFLWVEHWNGTRWLAANGMSIYYTLPKLVDKLPVVTKNDDFKHIYNESVSFFSLSIFDKSYKRIYHNVALDRVGDLPTGTYYVSIAVIKQGEYIAAGKKHEAMGIECVFRFIVP